MERDLLGAFPLASALAPYYFGIVCCVHFAGEAIDGHSSTGTLWGCLALGAPPHCWLWHSGLWSRAAMVAFFRAQREEKTVQRLPISLSSKGKKQKQVTWVTTQKWDWRCVGMSGRPQGHALGTIGWSCLAAQGCCCCLTILGVVG